MEGISFFGRDFEKNHGMGGGVPLHALPLPNMGNPGMSATAQLENV